MVSFTLTEVKICRHIQSEVITSLHFEPCSIFVRVDDDQWSSQKYNVMMAKPTSFQKEEEEENITVFYLKPSQPYSSFEFEKIFAFSSECHGYDPNRVVMITTS